MANQSSELYQRMPVPRRGEILLSPSNAHGEQIVSPYLQFEQVSIAFGSNQVLDGVSFSVIPGEIVCILGRSGVGKSVCLRISMGFLKPDEGHVIAAGEDITKYSEEEMERVRKITMVFQNGALFDSLTVGENVAFPLRERHGLTEEEINQVVDGLLEMVGVKSMRDFLPSEISVGFKRAVAIARALAARPEAVLYDEPTTMVDPLMARRLTNLVAKLKKELKLTSVVVTHDMRVAEKLADHLVFLEESKVVFYGTSSEMERSSVRTVREFLKLDRLDLTESVRVLPPQETHEPGSRIA